MHRIGIDLGGTKIEGVVVDAEHRPVFRTRIATESERGYEHIVERVAALAVELHRRAPGCQGIGIGTPGSISARDGKMKNCNTTCLNGRPLRTDLGRRLPLPVQLENDANCFALAEAVAGAGRSAEMVFGVIMGTGVGGGIVWRQRLWRGPQHLGGEWGHHRVDPAGPACYCGQRGCVETLIAGPAVERRYAALACESARLPDIIARARGGEVEASRVFDDFLESFGRCLANVVNILDPDCIVLGGGASNIDELYTRGTEAVRRYVFNDELRTPIVPNALGDSAGVIGAALLGTEVEPQAAANQARSS